MWQAWKLYQYFIKFVNNKRGRRKKEIVQQQSPLVRVSLYKVIVDVFNPIVVHHDAIFLLLSKNPSHKVPWIASHRKNSERPDNGCDRAKSLQLLHNFIIYNVFAKPRFYFAMICTILIKKAETKQREPPENMTWKDFLFAVCFPFLSAHRRFLICFLSIFSVYIVLLFSAPSVVKTLWMSDEGRRARGAEFISCDKWEIMLVATAKQKKKTLDKTRMTNLLKYSSQYFISANTTFLTKGECKLLKYISLTQTTASQTASTLEKCKLRWFAEQKRSQRHAGWHSHNGMESCV